MEADEHQCDMERWWWKIYSVEQMVDGESCAPTRALILPDLYCQHNS